MAQRKNQPAAVGATPEEADDAGAAVDPGDSEEHAAAEGKPMDGAADADVADGPAFRSDPRSRPDQSTRYWLKNVFSTRAMSSGATTCPCPSSVCRSVWGMAAVIAFAARSKKSVGRPANWGSVVGPSVVTRTD